MVFFIVTSMKTSNLTELKPLFTYVISNIMHMPLLCPTSLPSKRFSEKIFEDDYYYENWYLIWNI
jgi:hypothetical protein